MMRQDPGPCPICGAAHTACASDTGPITIAQLPARDAAPEPAAPPATVPAPPFSTAEYDRTKHGLKRPR